MNLDLLPFKALIKDRCGLHLEGNGEEKLARSLAERIEALTILPAEYFPLLSGSEVEFQELVNLLTINETYFFREPEQIRLLVDRLAPRFLAAHAGMAQVRILSAGCSSGEEPYSLALALLDKYGESVPHLFSLVGADIDSAMLARARQASYHDYSFRAMPADMRGRYFDQDGHGSLLKAQIKNLVSFHELNLLAHRFPVALQDFDIIFFRNVSIYFDAPTRIIIQQNLASLMRDNGILVIGTAETLANDLGVLPLVEEDGLYYFIKGNPPLPEATHQRDAVVARTVPPSLPPLLVAPRPEPVPTIVPQRLLPTPPSRPAAVVQPPQPANLDSVRQLTRDRRYDEVLPQLDALLFADPGNTEARLLKAYVLINRKNFVAAEELAQHVLAADSWSIDALVLLGLAAKWRQQIDDAIHWFKRAVYACHACWQAHYYLADLYRGNGETEPARRAYRVVLQLLSGSEVDSGLRCIPLALPAGEIRFLCEHQLARLPAALARPGKQ
ncbi:MAG: hypothetical protein BWK76_05035 [Desulfobulbaceae bacterium A2]|nr:MAG: hypothetical protein BWK76_05035 [Desulfobulbaceae bacterium A2]